jgi:hypothetical protein
MRLTTFWAQGLPLVLHYYWTVVEVLNPEPLVKVLLASTVQEAPPRILLLPTVQTMRIVEMVHVGQTRKKSQHESEVHGLNIGIKIVYTGTFTHCRTKKKEDKS